jgi:hypothetical protein
MLAVFLLLVFLVSPQKIAAQVVIDEVMANPISGESDWVKFFNTATTSASLSGWEVEDVLSSPSVVYSFAQGEEISGEGFLTINISNKLNNSGDGVILKNSLGEVVDEMNYQSSSQGVSWLRGTVYSPEPSASPTTSPVPSSSPLPTPSPSPQVFSHDWQLKVTEIMSCPISPASEWIKIENLLDKRVVLDDFIIRDQNNNKLEFSLVLGANESSKVELERNVLNNSGDKLYLLAPDEWQFDFVQIPACEVKGESFIKQDGEWVQLSLSGNTQPSPSPSASPLLNADENEVVQPLIKTGQVLGAKSYYDKNYYKNIDFEKEAFIGEKLLNKNTLKINSLAPAKWPTIFVILSGTLLMLGATLFAYAKIAKKNSAID